MAKIGLIYLNDQPDISMGLAYISAVLKQNGHEVLLWDTYYKNDEIIIEEMIKSDIQIAMFSVHSMAYKHSLKIINAIKEIKANLPILVGGWHTLIDPEGILNQPSVDMICVGEGEYAALDVANDLDKTNLANIDKIPNIWSKKDGKIIRNPARKLDNLDNLPYPDRDIFHKDSIINKEGMLSFSSGRGCPYSCSYCCNKKMLDLYSKSGTPYLRFRNIEKCMEELIMIKEKYKPKEIFLTDENFLISDDRVKQFCESYKKNDIDIPFGFMARVEKVTDEMAKILKDAGCVRIHFGIESGNEELRRKYLNRKMTNEQIINAFDICRKYGIKTYSFNMIGLPFETKKTIKDTFEINKRCKPDGFQITIIYPFQGTEIIEIYKRNNMLNLNMISNDNDSYYDSYITKNPNLSYSYIKHQQVFMQLYFTHPKFFAYLSKIIPVKLLKKYMMIVYKISTYAK